MVRAIKRFFAGLLTAVLLVLGGVFLNSTPAEAATRVAVINFESVNVKVNGKTIKPAHNIKNVKRNTMTVRVYRCSFIQGLNKDGSLVKNRSYLAPGKNYKGGVFKTGVKNSLDDGTANQFGIFETACR